MKGLIRVPYSKLKNENCAQELLSAFGDNSAVIFFFFFQISYVFLFSVFSCFPGSDCDH